MIRSPYTVCPIFYLLKGDYKGLGCPQPVIAGAKDNADSIRALLDYRVGGPRKVLGLRELASGFRAPLLLLNGTASGCRLCDPVLWSWLDLGFRVWGSG